MKRFSSVFVGLILLIFTFQANAESPFIYGIHDHDANPREYLDHIRNGGAAGDPHWVKTRQRNAGSAGFELSMEEEEYKASYHGVEEDTAEDAETDHTTERVGVLAIEQSDLLTAKEY